MYDGYFKYGSQEAENYEIERMKEPLWFEEELFISEYFSQNSPDKVLDIPVGTGRFIPNYRNVTQVIGIDISENMLNQASNRMLAEGLEHITLKKGDIFSIDYPD